MFPRLLFRATCGTDMTLALFVYVIVSVAWGERAAIGPLVGAIIFSHWLDTDIVPYLLLRKRWCLRSHWVFFHHPPLALLLAGMIGWLVGEYLGGNSYYWCSLAMTGTLGHCGHDLTSEVGFPIFSPFWDQRWRLELRPGWKPVLRRMSPEEVNEAYRRKKLGKFSTSGEIAARMPLLTKVNIIWWLVAVGCLIAFWLITY